MGLNISTEIHYLLSIKNRDDVSLLRPRSIHRLEIEIKRSKELLRAHFGHFTTELSLKCLEVNLLGVAHQNDGDRLSLNVCLIELLDIVEGEVLELLSVQASGIVGITDALPAVEHATLTTH